MSGESDEVERLRAELANLRHMCGAIIEQVPALLAEMDYLRIDRDKIDRYWRDARAFADWVTTNEGKRLLLERLTNTTGERWFTTDRERAEGALRAERRHAIEKAARALVALPMRDTNETCAAKDALEAALDMPRFEGDDGD